jgi:hypothetical protein
MVRDGDGIVGLDNCDRNELNLIKGEDINPKEKEKMQCINLKMLRYYLSQKRNVLIYCM